MTDEDIIDAGRQRLASLRGLLYVSHVTSILSHIDCGYVHVMAGGGNLMDPSRGGARRHVGRASR